MVPEAGAWAGFVAKTPAARPIVVGYLYEKPDRLNFSYEKSNHHHLPDDFSASWI